LFIDSRLAPSLKLQRHIVAGMTRGERESSKIELKKQIEYRLKK